MVCIVLQKNNKVKHSKKHLILYSEKLSARSLHKQYDNGYHRGWWGQEESRKKVVVVAVGFVVGFVGFVAVVGFVFGFALLPFALEMA